MRSDQEKQGSPCLLRAVVGFAVYMLLVPASLFVAAGTLDWPMAWIYLVLSIGTVIGSRILVLRVSPDTLRERARYTQAEGTPTWDRILSGIVAVYGPLLTMVVAGLDHRWGWSGSLPPFIPWVALLTVAAGFGFSTWAMVANRYFSAVARIQGDRGHVVVKDGPYGWVRHPAYAGSILASLAFPLVMETLWAYIPVIFSIMAVIVRTYLEDQMLRRHLEGYEAYAAHEVRHRLLPFVW
ncbi:MAG: isoprenylcysteine carboxylmethyltransferase family protein [Anaerolineales bacterium]|jgi:protein-S-isoprenylcysteine O-methyltransferase Ste14